MPDHVHQRHHRRGEGDRPRPALPLRPAPAGRDLARRARRAIWSGARRPAAGRSRRATCSSRPWLRGAAALLHDARFDPEQRLAICAQERVDVLCMAPTEYRVIAKRTTLSPIPSLRGLVAAGEALNPEVLAAFREALGLEIRDGYGQTETGQLTGDARGRRGPARLDGQSRCRESTSSSRTASSCCATRAPTRRSSSATSTARPPPTTSRGEPATACAATTTATCTSSPGPTT